MVLSELEKTYSLPPTLIIKRPTVGQIIQVLENYGKKPQTAWLTLVDEHLPNQIGYEVVDPRREKEIVRKLETLNPFDELPGEIIFHRLPKI